MKRRNASFLAELGPGGPSSLALALASAVSGLGVPVLLCLRNVLAGVAGDRPEVADLVLVLGRELVDDRPTPVFVARLEHAAALLRAGWAPRILVSGGMTGTARRSEAEAGRDFLVERGVDPKRIEIEERSRHTLENLSCVRDRLRVLSIGRVLLVSDPLHLTRAAALARGLGLEIRCSPASDSPPRRGTARWWRRAMREAFLLHWYRVGVVYSRAFGLRRALARVT